MGAFKLLIFVALLSAVLLLPPQAFASYKAQVSANAHAPRGDLMLNLGAAGRTASDPLGPPLPSPDNVYPPDNRTLVNDRTDFPWRTMAKLLIYTDPSGPSYECSGVLVSPIHVVTAGHCINDKDFTTPDHQAIKIMVIPASGGSQPVEPYGHAFSKILRVLPNWRILWNYQDDLGMITLDSPLGNTTGWLDLRADPLWSPLYMGTLYTAGYPGDKLPAGENLYSAVGKGCRVSQDNLWYTLDTYSGQSGSPIWALVGQTPVVVSIVTYGAAGCNLGTRLGEGKLNTLLDWMRADNSGTSPLRYFDLTTPTSPPGNFTPGQVTSGSTKLTITHAVVNHGTMASGPATVYYYASQDSTIDPQDILLGTEPLASLNPSASTTVTWSGTVPANLTGGRYWIGWIIQSGNASEIDGENNAAYVASAQVSASNPPVQLQPATVAAVGALVGVPLAILIVVLYVARRRPVAHPAWFPQPYPPPPPDLEPVLRFCGHCGTPFLSDMHFCANCGAYLG